MQRRECPDPVTRHRIRRWWAAQVRDAEIARRLGVRRRLVCDWRRRLGLPAWYSRGRINAAMRERVRQQYRRELERRGVRTLQHLAPDWAVRRRAELAGRYGLPADLHLTETRILLGLAGGPLTALALARSLGLRPDRSGYHSFNADAAGGNYLTSLLKRGLVAKVPGRRGAGNGSGRGESVYLLTPLAMDMLATPRRAQ